MTGDSAPSLLSSPGPPLKGEGSSNHLLPTYDDFSISRRSQGVTCPVLRPLSGLKPTEDGGGVGSEAYERIIKT